MKNRRYAAVELLMSYPDSVVAEMLGIKLRTLTRWSGMRDFAEALKERERRQRESLARIARQAALRAAASLCQATGEPSKADAKVLLEVLKASGAFEPEQADPADALAEVVGRVMNAEEEKNGGSIR